MFRPLRLPELSVGLLNGFSQRFACTEKFDYHNLDLRETGQEVRIAYTFLSTKLRRQFDSQSHGYT